MTKCVLQAQMYLKYFGAIIANRHYFFAAVLTYSSLILAATVPMKW